MFSAKKDSNGVWNIYPKWTISEDRRIEFNRFKLIEGDEINSILLDRATFKGKQWKNNEIGSGGEYVEISVIEELSVLKLISKPHQIYGKERAPSFWDELIWNELKEAQFYADTGIVGFIECSERQKGIAELYLKEENTARKQLYREAFIGFETLDIEATLEFTNYQVSTGGSSYQKSPKKSQTEILDERYTWLEIKLSKLIFNDENHTLTEIHQYCADKPDLFALVQSVVSIL